MKITKEHLKKLILETLNEALTDLSKMSAFQISRELRGVDKTMIGYYGYENLSAALQIVQRERDELNKEYNQGDRNTHPPDWYDQNVLPLDQLIDKIEGAIKSSPDNPNSLGELTDADKFEYEDIIEIIERGDFDGMEREEVIEILIDNFDVDEEKAPAVYDYAMDDEDDDYYLG